MVPISKSIWPFILFVYLNLHFMLIVRFNSLCCFSKIFLRERSSPPPPNFAPPFCAFCLIVCDFLPKTWNLGRKEGKSALSGAPEGTPPVAYGDSPLGDGAFGIAAQFPVKPESFPLRQRLPPRGSWLCAAKTEGVPSQNKNRGTQVVKLSVPFLFSLRRLWYQTQPVPRRKLQSKPCCRFP